MLNRNMSMLFYLMLFGLVSVVSATDDGYCTQCDEDFYCSGGTQTECPGNSGSNPGSSIRAECYCEPGFFGNLGIEAQMCSTCPENKYCVGGTIAQDCLSFSESVSGSDNKDDCKCSKGATGVDGLQCTQCIAGTFKSSIGSASCSQCIANTYNESPGRNIPCKNCPLKTSSLTGSDAITDCTCMKGYTAEADGVLCDECIQGTYKDWTGTGYCQNCPINTYSPTTAAVTSTVCIDCQQNSNSVEGSNAPDNCICNTGWKRVTPVIGEEKCERCPIGEWCYGGVGYTCQDDSTSVLGSGLVTDCKCIAGYFGADGDECHVCGIDTYCLGGPSSTDCPEDSSSLSNSDELTDCGCIPGYEGQAGGICTECLANTFCSGGIKNVCPPHSNSSATSNEISDCICKAGYYGLNSDSKCEQCVANSYCIGGSSITRCTDDNAVSPIGSDSHEDCACKSGWYPSTPGGICTLCETGSWCVGGSKTVCEDFSTTVIEGASTIASCKCVAGYTRASDGACKACIAGTYKDDIGSQVCTPCGLNYYLSTTGATSQTLCQECPPTTYSSSPIASARSACICNAGYTGAGGDDCTACIPGTYKIDRGSDGCTNCDAGFYSTAYNAIDMSTCVECGSESQSAAGSNKLSDCICNTGFYNTW